MTAQAAAVPPCPPWCSIDHNPALTEQVRVHVAPPVYSDPCNRIRVALLQAWVQNTGWQAPLISVRVTAKSDAHDAFVLRSPDDVAELASLMQALGSERLAAGLHLAATHLAGAMVLARRPGGRAL